MATRKRARTAPRESAAHDAGYSIADSAQKIWLAGLGAFERARADGPRMFDALVEQGRALGGKARGAADEALRNVMSRKEVVDLSRQVRELSDELRAIIARGGDGPFPRSARAPARKSRKSPARAAEARRKTKRAASKAPRKARRRS